MNKDLSLLPKFPSICMKGNIEPFKPLETNKILLTKVSGMPYIPRNEKYPVSKNGCPMICIAQLNYDQIFELLDSKENLDEFVKYFSCVPKTGILQIYLDYSEKLFDDYAVLHYIKDYSVEMHDLEKEKSLLSHYEKYYNIHGSLTSPSFDEVIYLSNMKYQYNNLNSTNQSHPKYEDFFGDDDEEPNDEEPCEEKYDSCAQIGGYPYHLQDDMAFNDKTEIILFSFVDGITGLNISVKKTQLTQLTQLNFKKCGFDLSYD